MKIEIFGQLVDIIGGSSLEIDTLASTDELKSKLFELYPLLKQKTFLIALNQKIINQNSSIEKESEIALLPPYSGG